MRMRTYCRGKKAVITVVNVRCSASLAEAVLSHLTTDDVVLVSGSLENDPTPDGPLQITAAAVQFL